MHAWESIQTTLELIEERLSEEISIDDLANAANLSPFYYQRLFKRLVNKTVMEYIKLRRLAKASEHLAEHKNRILDVALNFGFESHETFTRAFKKAYGLTPEEYRANPVKLNQFVKPELILNYIMVDEGVPLIVDDIVIEVTRRRLSNPRTFIGIEKEIPICQLMGGETTGIAIAKELWMKLGSQKHNIPNKIPGGNEFAALYMGSAKEGNCMYMAGIEVEPGTLVEGYSIFELPAKEYLVCGFEAENFNELVDSAVFKADKFMERWMKNHNLIATDFAIEMYYPTTPEVAYMEHWTIPVSIEQ
ncbi:AraC family transcriptional regulator [Clostridioides sp. ES-S-0049-02]|uniref:AraC family transcriptional regulator n=1 Tax=Clostridioides sp. ES-S-0049-02 TaxID=2770778 RepID=UPI001D116186|nr:AraC family transcriptional regulator [Clostridioides sp. ES-S-0049-02]